MSNVTTSHLPYVNSNYTINTSDLYSAPISVGSNAVVIDGSLKVNGIDVGQVLEDAVAVLGIIKRDPVLESRYAGLREIAKQYEEALEKYKAFEAIKDSK